MKRTVKAIGPSHLRRLQDKWKSQGAELLAVARHRVQQRQEAKSKAETAARNAGVGHAALPRWATVMQEPAWLKAAQEAGRWATAMQESGLATRWCVNSVENLCDFNGRGLSRVTCRGRTV
jgi:hypothetical protein